MASNLRYDGKVVVVTGAGAGLGRAYALYFAERGAKVVVNDLGGDIKGEGASGRVADQVVNQIKAKGGTAVANYNSVEDGEKVIQTALDNFGRIDILINNAGILRDRSFARTSDLDWDLIHRVHLRGSFMCSRAAWEHMKKQKYGRIIMTTSAAGIYGNFGQANYSSAKLGLLGLSNTLAIEGKKYNIHCNTIAPTAGSRLTETVMTKEIVDLLKPEYVAPLVLYLTHDSCEETGGLFEVGVGLISKVRWQKTKGVALLKRGMSNYTPEQVRDNWDKITDFEDEPWYPQNINEANSRAMAMIGELVGPPPEPTSSKVKGSNKDIDPELAKQAEFPPSQFSYTDREVILYALGVGVSTKQQDHLNFLYEYSSEFSVLPTFGVIPAFGTTSGIFGGGIPGLRIDPTKILHGEQYLEIYKTLPTSATLTTRAKLVDVLDKGSGAVLIIDMETSDEKGEKVCFNQFTTFVQGAGGFGGKRASEHAKQPVNPPKRAPDASIQEKTDVDQAALYRLSGDRNPLHLDPAFAAMGGFKTPILHGLASFGFAGRAVLKQYCNNDVTKFKAMKVRFNRPVLPGETLQTDMWREGNRIHFTTKVVESGNLALAGAYVDLVDVPAASIAATPSGSSLQADAVFSEIAKRVSSNPGIVKKVGVIYQFNITKGGKVAGSWTADLKTGSGSVYAGAPKQGKASCTFTLSDDDMVGMATGKLDAQKAFMTGKLKIGGNIMLAQKLSSLFQDQSKL